jgi:hypothetical protein
MKKGLLLFVTFALTACSAAATPSPRVPATDTALPISTATPSPTATPTPTPVPSGPCDNPLVPLAVGNQWTYRAATESGESLFTLKSLERQDAANIVVVVEFTDQKNNNTVHEPVVCQDGAIQNFPLFVMDMLFTDYLNKLFNTYHDKGDYAPAYSSFVEQDWVMDWQAEYLTEEGAVIKNPMGGSSLLISQSSPINLSFQMDGSREPITVPAGEFPQAIKVSHSFTLPTTVTLLTGGSGATRSIYTTQWYVPYVGLVRAQVDSASLALGVQDISVPLKGSIELTEFMKGN